ncbi:hypothetical protein [Parasedimentitalea marina]|uniref:hypothetical protein n=1 Tax=Parasedimentitalea marina TaxID=2483033 RepID=UPI001EE97BBA|nr:hypothetical protein [Parasedimentitalea marina]
MALFQIQFSSTRQRAITGHQSLGLALSLQGLRRAENSKTVGNSLPNCNAGKAPCIWYPRTAQPRLTLPKSSFSPPDKPARFISTLVLVAAAKAMDGQA